ncbi:hypothetical protein V8E36_003922, partial [Tilletia maclaganii]
PWLQSTQPLHQYLQDAAPFCLLPRHPPLPPRALAAAGWRDGEGDAHSDLPEQQGRLLPLPPPKPDPLPQSAAIALDVKAKLLAWREEKATGDFRARLARSPLGLAALLRDEDIADLVSNIGKVAHGLKPDSPAVFQLRNFVRSRFATEILSDVRGVIEGVLAEFRARAQASLQAAQQTREAAAARRARQKDEREQAKFWQECQRKKTEAQAENREPRQCGGCRKWLEQHPGWNEQNPSQYVEPYGHY